MVQEPCWQSKQNKLGGVYLRYSRKAKVPVDINLDMGFISKVKQGNKKKGP